MDLIQITKWAFQGFQIYNSYKTREAGEQVYDKLLDSSSDFFKFSPETFEAEFYKLYSKEKTKLMKVYPDFFETLDWLKYEYPKIHSLTEKLRYQEIATISLSGLVEVLSQNQGDRFLTEIDTAIAMENLKDKVHQLTRAGSSVHITCY